MKIFGTDFDGVIINIELQKAAAFGMIVEKEWGLSRDVVAKYWMATGGIGRRTKFDYFYHKRFGKDLSENEYLVIEKRFSDELKNDYYPKVKLLPGALDLLRFIKDNFDFTFVSSGVPMEEINYLVNSLNLSEYFDLVLGTSNTYKSKSDHFREILADKNPDLLVFIADGAKDMEVAKEFGAKSVGILTNCPRKELQEAGANVICNTTFDTIPIIKSWL